MKQYVEKIEIGFGAFLVAIKDGDKTLWGMIDKYGHEIVPCEYDEVRPGYNFDEDGELFESYNLVKKNGLWGILHDHWKVDLIFDDISEFHLVGPDFAEFPVAKYNGFWGVGFPNNAIVPFVYDYIGHFACDGEEVFRDSSWAIAQYKGKWGVLGVENEKCRDLVPFIYEDIEDDGSGYLKVKHDGVWNTIDERENEVEVRDSKIMDFKVCIDGNYYEEDEEYEVGVKLSEEEIASIRKMVNEYEGNLSRGLMPILKECSKELYQRFYDIVFPDVFYTIFRGDPCFEPLPQDENKSWTFDDVYYLMETYGNHYCCDNAYQVYIPEDMMPPKIQLSKDMSKDGILKYIRQWNSKREDIFDWITTRHDISDNLHDSLYEVIENRLLAIAEQDLAETKEDLLSREDYDPFWQISTNVIADDIYKEFQEAISR